LFDDWGNFHSIAAAVPWSLYGHRSAVGALTVGSNPHDGIKERRVLQAALHHGIEKNSTFDIASRIICDVEIGLNLAGKLLFISFFGPNGRKQLMEQKGRNKELLHSVVLLYKLLRMVSDVSDAYVYSIMDGPDLS
jgi:hypothetical protein